LIEGARRRVEKGIGMAAIPSRREVAHEGPEETLGVGRLVGSEQQQREQQRRRGGGKQRQRKRERLRPRGGEELAA